jgi:hypothetical protein
MATGRLAFALDGRAAHHGCSAVSAGAAAAGHIVATAPNPAAPALMNPRRPGFGIRDSEFDEFLSAGGRDRPSEFFMIVLREQASAVFSESNPCGRWGE